MILVKNRLSDPTKEQDGQDQWRNDIKSDCWGKALKEGCCERTKAQTCVSPIEKTVNIKDLTRVMAKTQSWTQTVTMGCVGQVDGS